MARTTIAAVDGTGKYPTSLTALTLTAADASNGNQTVHTGNFVLFAINTHASTPYDVTLTSAASSRTGRTADIVKEIAAGEVLIIGPLGLDGYRQTDGYLYFSGENAAVKFAVVRV